MAQAFAVVLMERVPSMATRDSAPTWSTPGRPWRKARNAESERVTSSYGGSGAINARASSGSASGSSTWVMGSLSPAAVADPNLQPPRGGLAVLPCPARRVKHRSSPVEISLTWGFVVRRVPAGGRLRTADRMGGRCRGRAGEGPRRARRGGSGRAGGAAVAGPRVAAGAGSEPDRRAADPHGAAGRPGAGRRARRAEVDEVL